jgi:hypothetical protein
LDHTNVRTNSGKSWIRYCFYEPFLALAVPTSVTRFDAKVGTKLDDVIDGDVGLLIAK